LFSKYYNFSLFIYLFTYLFIYKLNKLKKIYGPYLKYIIKYGIFITYKTLIIIIDIISVVNRKI